MADLSHQLTELTRREVHGVPAVVAIASNGAKEIVRILAGYRKLEGDDAPVTSSSIFQYSSATKVVTAIAALQCVESGLIGLDNDVTGYLPELKQQQIVSFASTESQDSVLQYRPRTGPITLRQLLTHTSGLGSEHMDPRLQAWRKSTGSAPKGFAGNAIDAFSVPLLFEPGPGWAYGASFEAVGVLVSRLNDDMGLEQYMRKHIFGPLGLTSSTFMPEDDATLPDQLVQCVTRTPEGTLVPYQHGTGKSPSVPQGGGGLYSNPEEHHAILADIMSSEPKLLRPETIELLFSPQLEPDTPSMEAFQAMRPLLNSLLGSLTEDRSVNHSLGGVLLMEDSPTLGGTKGTVAWAGATGTFWFMNREHRLAASYASQVFPIMDSKCLEGIAAFVRAVWEAVK